MVRTTTGHGEFTTTFVLLELFGGDSIFHTPRGMVCKGVRVVHGFGGHFMVHLTFLNFMSTSYILVRKWVRNGLRLKGTFFLSRFFRFRGVALAWLCRGNVVGVSRGNVFAGRNGVCKGSGSGPVSGSTKWWHHNTTINWSNA